MSERSRRQARSLQPMPPVTGPRSPRKFIRARSSNGTAHPSANAANSAQASGKPSALAWRTEARRSRPGELFDPVRTTPMHGWARANGAVFEDAQAGVRAGIAGGFGWVVGVDRLGQGAELARNGADEVVRDLGELLRP